LPAFYLKTGLDEFPLFKTKLIRGYSYASVILENIKKKNICARSIDDFDAEKYCDRNCREPTWSSALIQWSPLHCQIEKLPFNPVFKTG